MDPLNILIIDDVPSARKVLRRLLEKLDQKQVREAKNGKEGFDLLCGPEQFNLLIADLNLGDFTAIDLLNKLKEIPTYQKIPTIIVTSDADVDSVQKSVEAGASSFLLKPFGLETLKSKIAELMEKSVK